MGNKMGIIGYGGMAAGYHHESAKRDDIAIEPVAAYDINPERVELARQNGLIGFDDLNEFLASNLFDFVVVATSNNFHCEMICRSLEAGYHTMCEKPVSMNVAELKKMIATSEKTGKLFTVHQNRRWDRDFMIVKQLIEEGTVGTPVMIESRIHVGPESTGCMGGWRGFKDHGGGMFLDWGIHMMDQILYMIQEPVKSVYAVIRNIKNDEVDDYAKVQLTFESGLAAHVEVATFTPFRLPRWYVLGTDGCITMDTISSERAKVRKITGSQIGYVDALAYSANGVEKRPQKTIKAEFAEYDAPEVLPPQDWATGLYSNVINALDGKEELIVKPAQVLRCFEVMFAAIESSKTGKSVEF